MNMEFFFHEFQELLANIMVSIVLGACVFPGIAEVVLVTLIVMCG